jgi:hypothetical protein
MRTPQSAVAGIAADQHSDFTVRQALERGLTPGLLRRWLTTGTVARAHQGVYRFTSAPESWQGRLLAAVLAGGGGSLASHRSAARLWRLRDVPRWRPEITTPGTRAPLVAGVVCHRTDRLDAVDVSVTDGVPCTTVARTLLDLGGVVHRTVVRTAAEDALLRGLVSLVDLVCLLERVGGRGRRGTKALRWTLRGCLPAAGLESRLEAALLRLIRSSGAPEPVPQHEVRGHDGRTVRLDFAWPALRIAVEADGRRWHSTTADFERDMARANRLAISGWQLLRFGWNDVHHDPARVIGLLRCAFGLAAAA